MESPVNAPILDGVRFRLQSGRMAISEWLLSKRRETFLVSQLMVVPDLDQKQGDYFLLGAYFPLVFIHVTQPHVLKERNGMRNIRYVCAFTAILFSTEGLTGGYLQRMPDGSYSGSDGYYQSMPDGSISGPSGYSQRMPDGSYSTPDGYMQRMPDGSFSGDDGYYQHMPDGSYSTPNGYMQRMPDGSYSY